MQRLFAEVHLRNPPWRRRQEAGCCCAPLRKPHENALDEHWSTRATFADSRAPRARALLHLRHQQVGLSGAPLAGRPAGAAAGRGRRRRSLAELPAARRPASVRPRRRRRLQPRAARRGKPFALDGVRILDFSWFLASAGGTRFLAALGRRGIKVEWKAHPDTRMGAMAPVGGRAARDARPRPLPGVTDPDMGGQFNNKNPGKRGLSLNVRHPAGPGDRQAAGRACPTSSPRASRPA